MLSFKERAYCERRAMQERQAALHARDPAAKAAHLKMARHYELMLDIEHGLPGERTAGVDREKPRFSVLPPNVGLEFEPVPVKPPKPA
ncbi:MAG: hypothetical protein J0626_11040 [Rhodospirillaceae bacterium]|nr:hypothetical protein [Rhodospirillaceae bacterium]